MVFVDPRVLEQLKDKESFEHEKQLNKKHSRLVEKKVTSASNLEIEKKWAITRLAMTRK